MLENSQSQDAEFTHVTVPRLYKHFKAPFKHPRNARGNVIRRGTSKIGFIWGVTSLTFSSLRMLIHRKEKEENMRLITK